MTTQPSSASDPGTRFVTAFAHRDFPRLAGVLIADVRMRALIPPGLVEVSGAEAVAAKFSSWFGDAEEFELVRSGSDTVGDRLHIFYRLRVKKPDGVRKIVEQHLLCAFDDERLTALDLVCTGFRPDETGAPQPVSGKRADLRTCQDAEGSAGRPKRDEARQLQAREVSCRATLDETETTGADGSTKRRHSCDTGNSPVQP